MQLISCHNGRLLRSALADEKLVRPSIFHTELEAIDELLPHGGFVQGAIHEILSKQTHGVARFFALLLAKAASYRSRGLQAASEGAEQGLKTRATTTTKSDAIVWCDPRGQLYPPAAADLGISLDRLYLLHPRTPDEQTWAIAECLRCKGVRATIAGIDKLSRIEARRLQLAAEQGGGVGIFLRPFDRNASVYAAATRWLVSPARGERTIQRWKIQLIHGHGGRIGQTVILELHRETRTTQAHRLHSSAELANRPATAATCSRASA